MGNTVNGFVYFLYDDKNKICRIGRTYLDTNTCRIKSQVAYYPYNLTIKKVEFDFVVDSETYFHKLFKNKKLNGDWFNISMYDIEDFVPICSLALGGYCIFIGRYRKIHYVHQLQNLFYTLTGEELTVKP